MHGAALVAGAAQQVAQSNDALADAANVEVARAIGVADDTSGLRQFKQAIVNQAGGYDHRLGQKMRGGPGRRGAASPCFSIGRIGAIAVPSPIKPSSESGSGASVKAPNGSLKSSVSPTRRSNSHCTPRPFATRLKQISNGRRSPGSDAIE